MIKRVIISWYDNYDCKKIMMIIYSHYDIIIKVWHHIL